MSKGRTALVAMLAGTLLLGPGPRSRAEQESQILVVGPIDGYGALLGGVSEGLQSAGLADAPPIRIDIRNARSDRKSTRLNSSHVRISYAVFCLKKKSRPAPLAPRVRSPPHSRV